MGDARQPLDDSSPSDALPSVQRPELAGESAQAHEHQSLAQVLLALSEDESRERISLQDMLEVLGDRAVAALMLVFALPNVFPTPPGTSTLLGAPLVFLSAQLMLGKAAWLPGVMARRSIQRTDFAALVRRILPWLVRAEQWMRPRLHTMCLPLAEGLIGAVCLVLSVILVFPIPMGNMLPALAICLMALGILQRDGLWILYGLAVAVASVLVVMGVVWGMIKAGVYLVKEWLLPKGS
jgi:hypothetical protein